MRLKSIWKSLALSSVLVLAGCQSSLTTEVIAGSQAQLGEKERLFAVAVLSGFDLNRHGRVTIGIEGRAVTEQLLRFLNASSPKLKFGNLEKGVAIVSVFNLEDLDYFHSRYAYLHIGYLGTLNGKGEHLGLVLRQEETGWKLQDTYRMDTSEKLDLEAYVREHITANQPPAVSPEASRKG